VKTDNSVC